MKIIDVLKSTSTEDGDGVKISRVSDFSGKLLDPFLMIDELKSDDEADFIGGFPPHPHRGIETFTYMIKGGFEHQDQLGNKKVISNGDVQWMSTGFGVVHSEMPVVSTEGMHGFQIWVNMPRKDKLRPAIYQDSVQSGLPYIHLDSGVRLIALAGTWQLEQQSVTSPLSRLSANASIADLRMPQGTTTVIDRSMFELAMIYIYDGKVDGYSSGHLLVVDSKAPISLIANNDSGVLIFSGNRLNEPIAHMGPFVMNTQGELKQAILDFQLGKFGAIPEQSS